jgi:hypothetical protein
MKCPGSAAKSRTSMMDALATVLPVLVADVPSKPVRDVLRLALLRFALPPTTRLDNPPAEAAAAIRWLHKASLPLTQLTDAAIVRAALDTPDRAADRGAGGNATGSSLPDSKACRYFSKPCRDSNGAAR